MPVDERRKVPLALVLFVLVGTPILAGCCGTGNDPGGPWPDRWVGPYDEGTGYEVHQGASDDAMLVDADWNPGVASLVLLYGAGGIRVVRPNGAVVQEWNAAPEDLNYWEGRPQVVRWLPNGTVLFAYGVILRLFDLTGKVLWQQDRASDTGAILAIDVIGGGTNAVLWTASRCATVHSLVGSGTMPFPFEGDAATYAAGEGAPDPELAALSLTARLQGYDNRSCKAEPARPPISVSKDGRWGVIGSINPWVVDLSEPALPTQPVSVPRYTAWNPVISPNGRFLGTVVRDWGFSCEGSCQGFGGYSVRVIDRGAVNAVSGFGTFDPFRLFVNDDGSAVAVQQVVLAAGILRTEILAADPDATPPVPRG